jgi:hypothetical protein
MEQGTPFGSSRAAGRALVLLAGFICACSSWQTRELPLHDTAPNTRLQVVQNDSVRVELEAARVVGDTLVGVLSESDNREDAARSIAIPLSRVSRAAVRGPDLLKTATIVAAALVLIAGVVFGLAFRQALSLWYEELADIE